MCVPIIEIWILIHKKSQNSVIPMCWIWPTSNHNTVQKQMGKPEDSLCSSSYLVSELVGQYPPVADHVRGLGEGLVGAVHARLDEVIIGRGAPTTPWFYT